MEKNYTILIAGGKTGGHLYPGIALAEVLRKRGHKIIFAGSKGGLEEREVPARSFQLEIINVGGLKGKSIKETVKNLMKIPFSIIQSLKIIKENRVDAVVSLGGFAAGPVAIAGKLKKIKVFAMEQNSVPGITTKIVSKFANKVYTTFPDNDHFFDERRTLLTGNPVREEILTAQKLDIKTDKLILAIFGGSQGAHSLNELVIYTFSKYPDLLQKFFVIHQTGSADFLRVDEFYKSLNTDSLVKPFFSEIGSCYKSADIVLCRAGATTITELKALKKPAIFLPFAQAADNHQYKNAVSAAQNGAGEVIEDSGSDANKSMNLFMILTNIIEGKTRYFTKEEPVNAAFIIADDIEKTMELK